MFYGTDTHLNDLPLPRLPQHAWTLLHEESPQNNIIFSFKGWLQFILLSHCINIKEICLTS